MAQPQRVGEEEPLISHTSDDITSDNTTSDDIKSYDTIKADEKWTCCWWLIILTITMFAILQIARLAMLVELTNEVSITDTNSTSIRTKLDYMLNAFGQSTYYLEYITLIYGLCKFRWYIYHCKHEYTDASKNRDVHDTSADGNQNNCPIINQVWEIIKNKGIKDIIINTKSLNICIALLLSVVHFLVSLIPPIILIIWKEDIVLGYKSNIPIANTYASLAFFDHIYNFLTRTGMVVVTVLVVRTWKNAAKNIKGGEEVGKMITKLVENYTKTGEYVNALQSIFQSWFVIKWIIYFFDIISLSVVAVEAKFNSVQNLKHELGFVFSHLIYDFLAFFFLFFCGQLMNLSHSKYYQHQQNKQQKILSNAENATELVILQSSSTLIPVNPEYDFLPSVCLIDFPLYSPGYIVTIFFALFAFVANLFLTQFQY